MQPRLWGFGVGDCSNLGLQSFNVNIKMHIPGFGAGELNWSPEIKNPIIFKTKLELLAQTQADDYTLPPSLPLRVSPQPGVSSHFVQLLTSCLGISCWEQGWIYLWEPPNTLQQFGIKLRLEEQCVITSKALHGLHRAGCHVPPKVPGLWLSGVVPSSLTHICSWYLWHQVPLKHFVFSNCWTNMNK